MNFVLSYRLCSVDGYAPYTQCSGHGHAQCRGCGRPDYRLCVCKLRAENSLAMSRQSDSESGTGGLECVTEDSRQTTPASASFAVAQLSHGGASGSTSSSSDLPPASKRTKRAS